MTSVEVIDQIIRDIMVPGFLHKEPKGIEPHMSASTEAPATPRNKTLYKVFSHVEEGILNLLGEAEGLNDVEAIKNITAEQELTEGQFVAIPARSHRIRTLAAKVERRVSIS